MSNDTMKNLAKTRVIFTVTNDLTYDQRMIRICGTLANHGYDVLLVGRTLRDSVALRANAFRQKRLRCIFTKGFLFYAEYNIRLFLYLVVRRPDICCAIDLDTILAVLFASKINGSVRIYDAHELFCEMKEIVSRPRIYRVWKRIEKFAVPHFKYGYTVNEPIAGVFRKMYNMNYRVIRNVPPLIPRAVDIRKDVFVLYQGAVNEGRCFETLIPAFSRINVPLVICGDGNFMVQARALVAKHGLEQKVFFLGKLSPEKLTSYTSTATIGITLFDDVGLSNYYSLANRFFDYIHAGVPQLCVNYPAYRDIVRRYEVAVLVDDLSSANLAREINSLLNDPVRYAHLKENCIKAREVYNWQNESQRLLEFYQQFQN